MTNRMERIELFADMARYVGKTVTIFTASGGLSGDVVIIGLNPMSSPTKMKNLYQCLGENNAIFGI